VPAPSARRLVLLGPGGAEQVPHLAVVELVAAGVAEIHADAAVVDLLAAAGVRHEPEAPLIAADAESALRLVAGTPGLVSPEDDERIAGMVAAAQLTELWAITVRLRRDCPWDREQTPATIVPHTVEEAYEVADVALAGPPGPKLIDELGDLLFQTFILSLMAREAGAGDLADVARGIAEKLVRRHPHVFGDVALDTSDEVLERWEAIKREQEDREGIFHDVPESLPALMHARKTQRRAAAIGFDWPSWHGAAEALAEEQRELLEEVARRPAGVVEPPSALRAEAGDLLFAAVNLLRLLDVDPETALRGASTRFRARVETAEALAAEAGETFAELPLDAQDRYYRAAKAWRAAAVSSSEESR
jgi:MazG family protein